VEDWRAGADANRVGQIVARLRPHEKAAFMQLLVELIRQHRRLEKDEIC